MLLRLCIPVLCLAILAACAARGPSIPPEAVPTAAEPLDPAITPLTREQDDQLGE